MLGEDDDLLISLVRVAFAVLHLHLQFHKTRSGKVRKGSTLARNPIDGGSDRWVRMGAIWYNYKSYYSVTVVDEVC